MGHREIARPLVNRSHTTNEENAMQSPFDRRASTIATLLLTAALVAGGVAIMGLAKSAPSAAPTNANVAGTLPLTPQAHRTPSPFGYLEFDWDNGVPGFAAEPTAPSR